jgi:O-antigen/teichoic acid export membrane protein
MALHTYVWLYFFNLLPNLAREFVAGVDEWRAIVVRSLPIAMWPACLCALGGTLIAPILIPLIFGPTYVAAVRPFQVVIWMIPVAWFSGHFRFSLIAAGQQRWEFAASAGAAVVVVGMAFVLGAAYGSLGAAIAVLTGGVVNTALALAASNRHLGSVPILAPVVPVVITTVVSLAIGVAVTMAAGPFAGAVVGCLLFVAVAMRRELEFVKTLRGFMVRQ